MTIPITPIIFASFPTVAQNPVIFLLTMMFAIYGIGVVVAIFVGAVVAVVRFFRGEPVYPSYDREIARDMRRWW